MSTDAPHGAEWGLQIEAPLRLADPDRHSWDESADLVVVGLGGAGVAAALEGVERGLKVIALDRYDGGGSSAANGGIYYAGGGTAIQREAGEQDSVEEMYKYLHIEVGGVVADQTLRNFCEESVATVDWMLGHGVKLNAKVWKEKTSYPPLDYFLYHPDSSLAAPYARRAKPAARGHRVFVSNGKKAWGLGFGIYEPLRDAALKRGLSFHKYAEVRQLALDASGRVVGVKALQIPAGSPEAQRFGRYIAQAAKWIAALPPSFPLAWFTYAIGSWYLRRAQAIEAAHRQPRWFRAARGVVLSAGGFIMNPAMVRHYAEPYSSGLPNGTLGDNGSGLVLGASAGGKLDLMNRISAWRFINPPKAWAQGMMLNQRGERFVNETLYGASLGDAIVEKQNGKAWIVLDARLRKQAFEQAKDPKIVPFQRDVAMLNLMFNCRKAPTLDALAGKIGFDRDTLRRTVDSYNTYARGEQPDPLEKRPDEMAQIGEGPYYAIDASIDSRLLPMATMTVGGLKVDEGGGMVLDAGGKAIPGLYAAGRNAVGICSNIYVSGLSYADCIYSGRRAARHAAALVTTGA
ncbi:FAD-binding protein [Nevskia soli]|uniref:FAD-binding protein n=1 Tax=Nevskia soli TaxID=418856 RepID=UPI0004A7502F|nr:FAD-binding protein [Nevskia soli]